MVQRRQWRLGGKDRWWILILIFFRSQLTIFLRVMILIQIRFLLRLSGRLRILVIRCSYQLIFWFCPRQGRRFLFRWCSVLWRSCWRHLLFRRSIIRGGIIICRFRFWFHRRRLVLNLRRQLWERVFQLRFQKRMCWMHHHLLRWFCQMAFIRQVGFRVQGRIVPNRRYRLGYLLNLRVLK